MSKRRGNLLALTDAEARGLLKLATLGLRAVHEGDWVEALYAFDHPSQLKAAERSLDNLQALVERPAPTQDQINKALQHFGFLTEVQIANLVKANHG